MRCKEFGGDDLQGQGAGPQMLAAGTIDCDHSDM
jgi:hypothetical protein